jgi:hypothetical protein
MEVTAAFYTWLKAQIVAQLTRVRFLDGAGVPVLALTTADPRVKWQVVAGNPIELHVTLAGTEADVVGKVFRRSVIHQAGDAAHAEPMSSAEYALTTIGAEDRIIFKHKLQVPEIA